MLGCSWAVNYGGSWGGVWDRCTCLTALLQLNVGVKTWSDIRAKDGAFALVNLERISFLLLTLIFLLHVLHDGCLQHFFASVCWEPDPLTWISLYQIDLNLSYWLCHSHCSFEVLNSLEFLKSLISLAVCGHVMFPLPLWNPSTI